jgi:hypothetical protein
VKQYFISQGAGTTTLLKMASGLDLQGCLAQWWDRITKIIDDLRFFVKKALVEWEYYVQKGGDDLG